MVAQHLIHHLLRLIEVPAPRGLINLLHGGIGIGRQDRHGREPERQGGSDERSSNEISHVQPQNSRLGR